MPLLGADQPASELHVSELRDQRGRGDLLMWATQQFADGTGLVAAIVTYQDQVAHVAWEFSSSEGGSLSIVAAAPDQQVSISTRWETPVDGHCCPVRPYTFVVAHRIDNGVARFSVVTDDRPWLGAFLLRPAGGSKTRVIGTAPRSPAAGVLQPLDVVNGVEGTTPAAPTSLGPAVIDEIAGHHPGDTIKLDIERAGKPMAVTVILGSRADDHALTASFPTPGLLGVQSQDMTQAVSARYNLPIVAGAVVVYVQPGSAAEKAGLTPGDIITGFDNISIPASELLVAAVATVSAHRTVPVVYVDSAGIQHSVDVTLGFPSANSATSDILMP